MESSGQCDVVDVVSGRVRQRPVLAPAGDAAVDEARIARETVGGAEPQPLGDPGTEPFDQPVGLVDETQGQRFSVRGFEIDRDRPAPAQQQVVAQFGRGRPRSLGPGRSMRNTVAPMSASSIAHIGAGPIPASSTILIPASGPTAYLAYFSPRPNVCTW